MSRNLEDAIRELSTYCESALPLYDATVRCLEEMKSEKKLSEEALRVMFSPAKIEETGRALKRRPSVVFIGNRNCGKSAILNELFQGSYLPVHETPCTSRIVKISHSSGENSIRVINKEGKVLRPCVQFSGKSKVVRDYAVVPDQDREDREELKATVEIELNHPLLQSGIQLIDSPGRNENDALDDVVDGFFEEGSTPLVVYIIDGNEQLRPTDQEAIRLLQDKCPHISFIFVCNKVETSTAARDFDDDDEEEDREAQKPDKQKTVFLQLQRYGFLPDDATLDSCSNFHGISALNVRNERRGTKKGKEATTVFENFKKTLFKILEETIKRQTRQSVGKLLSMIMSFLAAVVKERRLTAKNEISEWELKYAIEYEKDLFTEISSVISSEENVRSIVKCNLLNLEEKCLQAADDFHPERTVSRSRKTEHSYDQFLCHMKGIILDQAFNALRCAVNAYLLATAGDLMQRMTKHSRIRLHPFFHFMLNMMYSPTSPKNEEIEQQLEKEASRILRNELLGALSEGLLFAAERKSRINIVDSKERRRSVIQKILVKFSNERVAKAICETCRACLLVKHNTIVGDLTNPNLVTLIGSKRSIQQLKELGVLYTPRLNGLAMQILALSFSLRKGRLAIGALLKPTRHGKIYSCTGWTDDLYDESCAVKVIEEEKVEASYWQQTASDLIHCRIIQDTSDQRPQNLLHLYGWLTPKPGKLCIVMEKAKVDLTTALREGLPLKTRAKIALDVAHGICEIHQAGHVAQDIKADSILIAKDDTAKINLTKPEKPFEKTSQGTPFHISKEMHANYEKGRYSDKSFDIYAFGMLLWVLCEGSGARRPEVYKNFTTKEAMKIAVERGLFPERPKDTPEAWWDLMTRCWENRLVLTSDDLLAGMRAIFEES